MMNRFLLALILIFGVSGAMGQTLGNPTFNSLTLVNPLSGAGVAFTPPGQPPETLQARGLFQSFVGDFRASGSGETTTGAIASGSAALTLLSTQDFANGEGVLVPGAGASFAAGQPSADAMVVGSPGSTTVYYDVASLDGSGGVGVPVQTSVTTGAATLTAQNYNWLAITAGSGATAYAVWKGSSATGPWTYIGSGQNAIYNDTGFVNPNRPWWIPANPPSSAQNDWLVARIASGGGSTSLTLGAAAANTVASATVRHDDTAAINAALAQSGADVLLPCGNYTTSSPIVYTQSNVQLWPYGQCTAIRPSGTSDDFDLIGTSSAELDADAIEGMHVVDTGNKAAGYCIYAIWVTKLDISNVVCDHPYSGMDLVDFNDVRLHHDRVFRYFGQQGNLLALRSDASNVSCCVDGTDFYGHSNATLGDQGTGETGYLIDGDVNTVVTRNFDLSDIAGAGMVVSNVVGNAQSPQFIQFTDFGAEYMTGRGVDLEAGQNIGFGGTSLVHAAGYGNFVSCASSADFYVANGVTTWGWIGGGFDNAYGDNIYVNAAEGTLRPQKVIWGSANTVDTCPGVEFGGSAAYVALTGAQIGDQIHPGWQAEPVLLDSGANNISICGNTYAGNVTNSIVDSSGETSNFVCPGAGDSAPPWAFDNTNKVFGVGSAATFASNGGEPGLIIRESNSSAVRFTLTNTIGSGAGFSDFHQSVASVSDGYADLDVKPNGGIGNAPVALWASGSGITSGIQLNSSAAAASTVQLIGGSGGVTVNPFIQFAIVYSVAGTPLPTCTTAMSGSIAYVNDATSSTYHGAYVGGGTTQTLVLCTAVGWVNT